MIVKLKAGGYVNLSNIGSCKFNAQKNLILNCGGQWVHELSDKDDIQNVLNGFEELAKKSIDVVKESLNEFGNEMGRLMHKLFPVPAADAYPARVNRTSLAHTIDTANAIIKNNSDIKKWQKEAMKLHEYLAQTEQELTDEEVKQVEDMIGKLLKLTEPETA